MKIKIDGGEGWKEEGEGERKSLMLDYWRLCLGQERERIEKLINEKNGVSCSTRISLSVFSFFNSDRYRYRSFFFLSFFSHLFSRLPRFVCGSIIIRIPIISPLSG